MATTLKTRLVKIGNSQGIRIPKTLLDQAFFIASASDALIHIDTTQALEPLDRAGGWERDDLPETFRSGE